MQITGMLEKIKVLPLPFYRIVYTAQLSSFIGKTRTFCKTYEKVQFFSFRRRHEQN